MANQSEILKILDKARQENSGATSPATIADELKSAEATIVTYLGRLRKRNYVDGGGQAWFITDAGKNSLARGERVAVTREDVGQDELSRFRIYGELASVDTDLLDACGELFQNADMRSMDEMERVLAEMNIPQTNRMRWIALYRGYLRNTTPPEKRDELYPLPEAEKVTRTGERSTLAEERKGDTLDYDISGNDIVRVGFELGSFTFRQALQVVAAKRGTGPPAQGQGGLPELADAFSKLNPNKPMSFEDVVTLVNMINENKGGSGDGAQEQQAQKTLMVSREGEITELEAGKPIVIKTVERQQPKTYYLNENQELVEQEPGKPIIIKVQPAADHGSGSGIGQMVPYPVMGADGQPVYDKDGRPVYANLEPMMKMLGFQSEQRRADERHEALMGLAKEVKENIGDGIAAIKAAAEEAKGSGAKQTTSEESPTYECGQCHTQFKVPQGDFEKVACPGCRAEYTREDVMGS